MNKNEINELLSWITRYSKHNQEGFYYDDLINVFGLKKELLDNLIKTKQLVKKNDLIYPSIYSIALASNQKTKQQNIILASDRLIELIKLSNKQYSKSLGFHLHSSDWKPYIKVNRPTIYKFIMDGLMHFFTVSKHNGMKYEQKIKFLDFRKIENALLMLFIAEATEDEIINFITNFFAQSRAKLFCTDPSFCLDENTIIPTLDGKNLTIKELYDNFNKGYISFVYSIGKYNNTVPCEIKKIWISGFSKNMIKVTLNNGKEIITTPEHYYILSNYINIKAKDLKIGDTLINIKKLNNYKVIKIEEIKYKERKPVYDIEVDYLNNFYIDAGTFLHNSFWGFHYILTQRDSAYGPGEHRPPDIRNPEIRGKRKGIVCKHLWCILSEFPNLSNQLAKELLPYYKRMFGIQSPQGVIRFKKKIGEKGLRDIYIKSIEQIEKMEAPKVLESYNKIMANKKDNILNLIHDIDKVPNNKPSNIKVEKEEQFINNDNKEIPKNNIEIRNGIKYKWCSQCHKWKPLANDYRIVRDSRKNKSYYKNVCKTCESEYKKAKRQAEYIEQEQIKKQKNDLLHKKTLNNLEEKIDEMQKEG